MEVNKYNGYYYFSVINIFWKIDFPIRSEVCLKRISLLFCIFRGIFAQTVGTSEAPNTAFAVLGTSYVSRRLNAHLRL
jgi:hypothetical protein